MIIKETDTPKIALGIWFRYQGRISAQEHKTAKLILQHRLIFVTLSSPLNNSVIGPHTAEGITCVQAAFYALFAGPGNLTVMITPAQFLWAGGALEASVDLQRAGMYQVSVLRASSNIQNSPFSLEVIPGQTSTAASTVFGSATNTIIAGLEADITVQVKIFQQSKQDWR